MSKIFENEEVGKEEIKEELLLKKKKKEPRYLIGGLERQIL